MHEAASVAMDVRIALKVYAISRDFDHFVLGLESEDVDHFFNRRHDFESAVNAPKFPRAYLTQIEEIFDEERDESLAGNVDDECLVELYLNARQFFLELLKAQLVVLSLVLEQVVNFLVQHLNDDVLAVDRVDRVPKLVGYGRVHHRHYDFVGFFLVKKNLGRRVNHLQDDPPLLAILDELSLHLEESRRLGR